MKINKGSVFLCISILLLAVTFFVRAEEVFVSGATKIPPNVLREYSKSYGTIELKLPMKDSVQLFYVGSGSGFLVDKGDRLVMTAHHIASRAGFMVEKEPSVDKETAKVFFNGIPLEYVMSLPAADLALFRAERIPDEMEEVSLGKVLVGEPVYSFARTAFGFLNFTDNDKIEKSMLFFGELPFTGSVVGVTELFLMDTPTNYPRNKTGLNYIVINQLPRTGFSGAPAFNTKGEAVGVIVGGEGSFCYLSSAESIQILLSNYKETISQKK